jgi:hypothetical protein
VSNAPTAVTPEAVLLTEVSVPEFFRKLAADTGISPTDADTSARLLGQGNLVANTIELYARKEAAISNSQSVGVVKAATDAAFAMAGLVGQQAQPEKTAGFLDVEGVRDAALLILANAKQARDAQDKAAAAGCAVPAMTPEQTEEEAEKTKKEVVPPKI